VDKKLQGSWIGHPQYRIINNHCKGFDEKITNTLNEVLGIVGQPKFTKFSKKFLLKSNSKEGFTLPKYVKYQQCLVTETILKPSKKGMKEKVIKRGAFSANVYTYEAKYEDESGSTEMTKKRSITARDYVQYCLQRADPERQNRTKLRKSFIYEKQHFVLDTLNKVEGCPSLLRIETEKSDSEIIYPPYLEILREVTDEKEYFSYNVCNVNYKLPEKDREILVKISEDLEEPEKPEPTQEEFEAGTD